MQSAAVTPDLQPKGVTGTGSFCVEFGVYVE